jgi:acyl-[acyl-carrier-protein]-phospholipid O-acyltransferase / long-chain-fatty-acid--[acyl-carrier-protein] ligase
MREGFIRLVVWLVSHGLFKLRVIGQENVPARGPALLASNHVTYADGFLIWSQIPRPVRFIVWKPFFRVPGVSWVLRFINAIPVADRGPRSMRETIRLARREIAQGGIVCIFPEGSITRDGQLHPFRRGVDAIVHGLDVPIIPVYLGGLWGNVLSWEGGRVFWKWPKRLRHRATVAFGKALPADSSAEAVQRAVEQLAIDAENPRGSSDQLAATRRQQTGA